MPILENGSFYYDFSVIQAIFLNPNGWFARKGVPSGSYSKHFINLGQAHRFQVPQADLSILDFVPMKINVKTLPGIPKLGPGKKVLALCLLWFIFITFLHHVRNGGHSTENALKVGFLPITCHLIVPVAKTHLAATDLAFDAVKFSAWPEMIEALRGGELDLTFILAPIAIALFEQDVPIRIVLLGHRDGTALVVRNDPAFSDLKDLANKTVAIPIRFSMQNLALRRLWKEAGLSVSVLDTVELPPPDMPSALASGGIDGYIVGEPYAAQAELAGTGRVLYHMKDVWPGFISSVVVVRKDLYQERKEEVDRLLREFYRQAHWIDKHRVEAARIAAPVYGLPESLIEYVLTRPPDRVSYRDIIPRPAEFSEISRLMVKEGLLTKAISGEELVDLSWFDSRKSIHGGKTVGLSK